MEELQFAEFRIESKKAILLLKRPPLNILNQAMCEELTGFLKKLSKSRDFDGLMITSEAKHFSAGADIDEHFPGKVEKMLPAFHKLLLTIATFPQLTLAAISGSCMGGGLELARACQRVVVWEPEYLTMGVPEIKLACFPPYALVVFPRFSEDLQATVRFLLTGQTLKGKTFSVVEKDYKSAIKMGLVDNFYYGTLEALIKRLDDYFVVEKPEINSRFSRTLSLDKSIIQEILSRIKDEVASLSSHVLERAIYVLAACAEAANLESALALAEQVYLDDVVSHPDYVEGLTAFKEKREPIFQKTGL